MIITNTSPVTLALVIPTWNEAENIEPLYDKICSALDGRDWELLFVDDDSADRTWDRVEAGSARTPASPDRAHRTCLGMSRGDEYCFRAVYRRA